MDKVRFEISDALGIITLANPPLNLFSMELIEDLRAAVTRQTDSAEGSTGAGRRQDLFRRRRCQRIQR